MIFLCLYALLSCVLCFHACRRVCFDLMLNVCIKETILPIWTRRLWETIGNFGKLSQPAITCSKLTIESVQSTQCSKLTIKTKERRHWRRSGVSIVNFEQLNAGWLDKSGAGGTLLSLSEAFDCIKHDLLVTKLAAYGFDSMFCFQLS